MMPSYKYFTITEVDVDDKSSYEIEEFSEPDVTTTSYLIPTITDTVVSSPITKKRRLGTTSYVVKKRHISPTLDKIGDENIEPVDLSIQIQKNRINNLPGCKPVKRQKNGTKRDKSHKKTTKKVPIKQIKIIPDKNLYGKQTKLKIKKTKNSHNTSDYINFLQLCSGSGQSFDYDGKDRNLQIPAVGCKVIVTWGCLLDAVGVIEKVYSDNDFVTIRFEPHLRIDPNDNIKNYLKRFVKVIENNLGHLATIPI